MTRRVEFPKFKPTVRDHQGAISVEKPNATGRRKHVVSDRWMRLSAKLATHHLATGTGEYRVRLGAGDRTRTLIVSVTDDQALEFFREWADRSFLGKGELRKAELWLERRRDREAVALEAELAALARVLEAKP